MSDRVSTAMKVTGAWCVMAILAVINGVIRDELVAPTFGMSVALPVSGITLSLLVVLVCFLIVPRFGARTSPFFIGVGAAFVLMTLAFEYLFGHFVVGKSIYEISQVFDVAGGNLFVLVLIVTLVAPLAVARWRSLL